VAGNIAFGLRMQGLPEEEIRRGVQEALALVNLRGFDRRRVDDLSGGEQQRVALARTLAPHPVLLMFDEPLAALDRALREELLAELRRLLQRLRVPAIYVTHDQEEAFSLGTHIALLHDGRIAQFGPPAEIIARPASAWVAKFLALGNLLPGRVVRAAPLRVETSLGTFPAVSGGGRSRAGDEGYLLLRPDGGRILRTVTRKPASIRGIVADATLRGSLYRVVMQSGEMEIVFHGVETIRLGRSITWSPAPGFFLPE
jgi:spermidine/putrescine transport system ATP-binding protein